MMLTIFFVRAIIIEDSRKSELIKKIKWTNSVILSDRTYWSDISIWRKNSSSKYQNKYIVYRFPFFFYISFSMFSIFGILYIIIWLLVKKYKFLSANYIFISQQNCNRQLFLLGKCSCKIELHCIVGLAHVFNWT